MSLSRIVPWLVMALAGTVGGLCRAAAAGERWLSASAAALAAIVLIAAALAVNLPQWWLPRDRAGEDDPATQARRNVRLMALAYAWGAAALLAVYSLAGLRWYHAWQYGAAMALLAGLLLLYAVQLGSPGSRWRTAAVQRAALALTLVQAAGAAAGAGYLLLSGKLATPKPDWVANHIFLAGAVALAALSLIAALTKWRLTRRR